ncbi:hypothetical protein AX14_007246 [Amanita brunnescens Koide BX004]|nr:hypothetical protein AX14_007246 [Amanita brunnescens Koide BX004]
MPRQSRSRPAPRPAAAPAQTRGAHTAAAPAGHAPTQAPAPPAAASTATAQSQGPGLLGQMAATAGSVAVGSTIGHGISNMLFGSSHDTAAQQTQAPPVQQQQFQGGANCEVQAKEFTKCLDKADLPSCTWYLQQLKACQAAAAPY